MRDPEQLRRYLRQLAELGDSELVLSTATRRALASALESEAGPVRHDAPFSDTIRSSDWRQALQAAGAGRRKAPDPSGHAERSSIPPAGITVLKEGTDIFDAARQHESLGALAGEVAQCRRCSLYKNAQNPVPGEGNPNAELVCVGEGPGASEDETGRPFVGAAGKLLGGILEAINLKRSDVFICNVVKHRPPANRTPAPDEIAACSPFLFRQLDLISPKVILALGTVAAQTLLGTKLTIGKLRGSIHRYNGVPLVVTYHPAALLRNPAWKRPTWEDVQLVRRILDGTADV